MNNRPLSFTDPTGFWDCAQDVEYNRCVQWITDILAHLENDGGYVASGLYKWFMEYDKQWIEKNGVGILLQIVDDAQNSASVPFCGGATGLCAGISDPTINIRRDWLAGAPSKGAAALFGHEVTHLAQGDLLAFSAVGEAGAYYVHGLLLEEFGLAVSGRAAFFLKQVRYSSGSYASTEVRDAKTELVNKGGYNSQLPPTPLNDSSGSCGYGICSESNYTSLIVEPARVFSYLGMSRGLSRAIYGGSSTFP